MKKKTDDKLMSLIAQGNQRAFEELFERHSGKLLGYACQFVSKEQAEELHQELWMKIIKLAPSYQGKGHFIAWSFTMLRNLCLNQIRRKHEDLAEDLSEHATDFSFEDEILHRFEIGQIKNAISKLPVDQKVAILLYVVEELNYQEISKEMNISLGAVKTHIFRARVSLKETLKRSL